MTTTPTPFPKKSWYHQRAWQFALITTAVLIFISSFIRLITPTPPAENTWGGVTPGTSTATDAQQLLGAPANKREHPLGEALEYSSEFPAFPHTVIMDQTGVVRFIKQYPELSLEETLSKYQEKLGRADFELFASKLQKAYVYLDEGVVLITPATSEIVEEKWYFEPTDSTTFMQSWGVTLSDDPEHPEEFEYQ